ncbi:MAG: hypothetical protein RIM99_00995 [Cyclobacteriaceae bacterium]
MLKKVFTLFLSLSILSLTAGAGEGMKKGTPDIKSMSKLKFNDDGILFLGDSEGGAIYAIDLKDSQKSEFAEGVGVPDIEGEIAGMLGTSAENVLIHDMAVNPVSRNIYLSVSRGRAKWTSRWHLPNDLASADVLIKISPEGEFSEVKLANVEFSSVTLPNPIDAEKEHQWKKGVKMRVDAITDLTYHNGNIYVAGLSNEEFAASMWVAPFPFKKDVKVSTLEIFHGAHGAYETQAPIRTFLPYILNNKNHIMAAYLCTPLVTFEADKLGNESHIKGRTVAEFGSGNYPLDMVLYQNKGKDYVLMSNSQLPLLIFDPADVESFQGEITTEVEGYLAGVKYTPRSGSGVQYLEDFNEKYIVATQRMPSGKLSLVSLPKEWLAP